MRLKMTPDWEIDSSKYSPSNINIDGISWFQAMEMDAVLTYFIKIFQDNGNEWKMNKAEFDKIIWTLEESARKSKAWWITQFIYNSANIKNVYLGALEIKDDKIQLKEYILQYLLRCKNQFSIRNSIKKFKFKYCAVID